MSYLSNKDKPLDGNAFLELLAEMKVASGMGGVKENLPWVQNNPALQEFKDQELIVCSLTPAERKDLSMVRIAAKKRIAASSNLPFASVESLLSQIENMAHIQKWMVKRIDDGKVLPKNAAEMQNMLTAPGEGIRKRNANRRRMSNPGMGKMSKMRKK